MRFSKNLVKAPQDYVQVAKALSDEVKAAGGDNAINVKVRYEQTFVDGFVNAITLGMYNPYTLTLEGDAVR
jgi:hypothetical protein